MPHLARDYFVDRSVSDAPNPVCMEPDTPVIDLVHLSHQSLGDPALEQELLALFDVQAKQIVQMLHLMTASKSDNSKMISHLAQTLKGSARAIGARRVASAAQALETALALSAGHLLPMDYVVQVDTAVDEAGRSVTDILCG
jgi:HPt (histidine-containing phosphotransfer) domain-containing protein